MEAKLEAVGLVTDRKPQVQTVLFPGTEPLVANENVAKLSVIMPTDLNYCEVLHTMHFRIASKAIPLQAWTGPEGSRRLRLPVFKTIVT